jgi:hypothetical protein
MVLVFALPFPESKNNKSVYGTPYKFSDDTIIPKASKYLIARRYRHLR